MPTGVYVDFDRPLRKLATINQGGYTKSRLPSRGDVGDALGTLCAKCSHVRAPLLAPGLTAPLDQASLLGLNIPQS